MSDTIRLNDRRGNTMVAVRGYQGNPGLCAVAGRIQRLNKEHTTAVERNAQRTYNILAREVNRGLRGAPATTDELLAALESRITIDGLIHKIQEMRDPDYYSEMAHGS
jgi:hypothetical protein